VREVIRDERRPRPESAADHNHDNDHSLDASAPIEGILWRLENIRRTGNGWSARCPSHDDRHASLSIAEADDRRVLLNCFAGCPVEDVVRALRLELRDLFPASDKRPTKRSRRARPKPYPFPRAAARSLLWRQHFAFEWEAAKLLALHPGLEARVEVLRNWDYLTERCDIGFVLRTAALIRGTALFAFCTARNVGPNSIQRAVRRLLTEVES